MAGRLQGASRVRDTLWGVQVVVLFVVYVVLDRLTRAAARVSHDAMQYPVLVAGAIADNVVIWLILAAVFAGALVWRSRMWASWHALGQGVVLRRMCAVALVFAAWSSSAYHYNFLAGQWHIVDRLLVAALAVASFIRPVFLVPFAIEARVLAGQFVLPFGTVAGPNIDALIVTVLVGFAALHLTYVLTGSTRSESIVLFLSTVVASHFFVPGFGKARMGWYGVNRLWNFPLSAYTAGWLGHTSGDWARQMARLIEPFNLPFQVVTLLVELGSGIAVVHPKFLRWWLVLAVVFHACIFAMTGFWFLAWMAVEIVLLIVVWSPSLRAWVMQNATPARGFLAAGIVMFVGARLYHPPTLSWFDGPVSYGYELEGVGVSGASYHVPLATAAPFEQELSFLRLRLSGTREASDAYGAVGTRSQFEALNAITSFDELRSYERGLPPVSSRDIEASRDFLARLLEHINRDGPAPRFLWPPPAHFWNSRPPPGYTYQEPLARLEAVRVTALHRPGGQLVGRETLVTVHAEPDGSVRATSP